MSDDEITYNEDRLPISTESAEGIFKQNSISKIEKVDCNLDEMKDAIVEVFPNSPAAANIIEQRSVHSIDPQPMDLEPKEFGAEELKTSVMAVFINNTEMLFQVINKIPACLDRELAIKKIKAAIDLLDKIFEKDWELHPNGRLVKK